MLLGKRKALACQVYELLAYLPTKSSEIIVTLTSYHYMVLKGNVPCPGPEVLS